MRKVYGIEVLERNGEEEVIVFTKPIPNLPVVTTEPLTRKELENQIKSLDIPWYSRDAMLASIFFLLDLQFPRHFYRICLVDWKY